MQELQCTYQQHPHTVIPEPCPRPAQIIKLDLLLFRNTIISDNKTVAELAEIKAWILAGIGSTKNIVLLPLEEGKDKRRVKCRWMLIRHGTDTKSRLNLPFVIYLVRPLVIKQTTKKAGQDGCFERFCLRYVLASWWVLLIVRVLYSTTSQVFREWLLRNPMFVTTISRSSKVELVFNLDVVDHMDDYLYGKIAVAWNPNPLFCSSKKVRTKPLEAYLWSTRCARSS